MKIKYPVVCHKSDAGYVIYFPDIPDCGTVNYISDKPEETIQKHLADAVSKASDEAAKYIANKIEKGDGIPKPYGNSAGCDDVIEAELDIGKFLPRDPESLVTVNLSIDAESYAKLENLASEQNITLDELVEELLFEQMLNDGYYWEEE